jgi:hypothetical protein
MSHQSWLTFSHSLASVSVLDAQRLNASLACLDQGQRKASLQSRTRNPIFVHVTFESGLPLVRLFGVRSPDIVVGANARMLQGFIHRTARTVKCFSRGIQNSTSWSCTVYFSMRMMLNTAAVILIEEPTSVYADLYVTFIRRMGPMGKEP